MNLPSALGRSLLAGACFLSTVVSGTYAQQDRKQTPPEPDDEIVRVDTELIQTQVTVLDKKGRFVEGLRREQFELEVEGKSQPIAFFDRITAGNSKAARPASPDLGPETSASVNATPGRTIVFFIDDLHLSLDSLARTRKMLGQFIETDMGPNDQAAIASTSGGIGFLQQFTDSKPMLRAAASRLTHHPYNIHETDRETAPMSEYIALTIERRESSDLLRFYVEECLKAAPLRYPRESCEMEVVNRARSILLQAAAVTANTYVALESLMRSAAQMPGRKVVFFVSDGFLAETGPRNSGSGGALERITDAALRSGIVIYTIDARGLISGLADATNNVPMDANGRLENAALREIPASQDALNALAADTGGRALRNRNLFGDWVETTLEETSNYYVLAWRPDDAGGKGKDFRKIAVRVAGRPDLTVRLPQGFIGAGMEPVPKNSARNGNRSPIPELQRALAAIYPRRGIPLSLSAHYLDTPEHGPVLTSSVEISNDDLAYESGGGKQLATVDLVGLIFDDNGKRAGSFQTRLKINPLSRDAGSQDGTSTIYNYPMPLAPGLYQVRVAARDGKSGQVGSAWEWIEIPDLASRHLSLSSLLLGLQDVDAAAKRKAGTETQVQFSVDHRFARNSDLRFLTFIYNAARAGGGKSQPDILIRARLVRAGSTIVETPAKRAAASDDAARIPYAGSIPLRAAAPGQYILEVTVTDQIANSTASQRARVIIE